MLQTQSVNIWVHERRRVAPERQMDTTKRKKLQWRTGRVTNQHSLPRGAPVRSGGAKADEVGVGILQREAFARLLVLRQRFLDLVFRRLIREALLWERDILKTRS